MSPSNVAGLKRLLAADPEANALYERKYHAEAETALHAEPQPAPELAAEGKLQSEAASAATKQSLQDMEKLQALTWAGAISGEEKYQDKARQFVLAWARKNVPDGNPINETALEPIFTAYAQFRGRFSQGEQGEVDSWLRRMVDREQASMKERPATATNNWNSHRIKVIGLAGFALRDEALINEVAAKFRQHIQANLQPDGSSFDFHHRDALSYHCYDLEPLLTFAIAAEGKGIHLYTYQAANGASLQKAVAFLVPFCDGRAEHAEWINSQEPFDRKRAAAGEADYKTGVKFNPEKAVKVLTLASAFDKSLLPLAQKIAGPKTRSYVQWEALLIAARTD